MGDSVAGGARSDLVGVALAAGAGRRLLPLTLERPKVLCPVGGRPLLGWALDALVGVVDNIVVNVHHHPAMITEWLAWAVDGRSTAVGPPESFWRSFASTPHVTPSALELRRVGVLADRAHDRPGTHDRPGPAAELWASIEGPEALGTAGALGSLAGFLDGRGVLAVNADTMIDVDLADVVAAWDGERPMVAHGGGNGGFRPGVDVVASITPASAIADLPTTPSGLFGHVWRDAHASGGLQAVAVDGRALDCGTPRSYLEANLIMSGGANSVEGHAAGAPTSSRVTRSVLWSGASVAGGESLDHAIRTTGGRTVLVRPAPSAIDLGARSGGA